MLGAGWGDGLSGPPRRLGLVDGESVLPTRVVGCPNGAGSPRGQARFDVTLLQAGDSVGDGTVVSGASPPVLPQPAVGSSLGGALETPSCGSTRKSARLAGRPPGDMLARASSRKAHLAECWTDSPQADPCVDIIKKSAICGIRLNAAEASDLRRCFSASS